MAVFDGAFLINGYEVIYWMDPKRYRCTIWWKKYQHSEFYTKQIKVMVDKDRTRLRKRVREYLKSIPAERS